MARKTTRTYKGMTVNVKSVKSVGDGKLRGILSAKKSDVYHKSTRLKIAEIISELNFEEVGDDKAMIIVGERKWIPIKVNRQYGIRVTKNKETGEYRILCTLTKERLQQMTLRECGELESEIGLMIERIRL